jgi:hypothetical protein
LSVLREKESIVPGGTDQKKLASNDEERDRWMMITRKEHSHVQASTTSRPPPRYGTASEHGHRAQRGRPHQLKYKQGDPCAQVGIGDTTVAVILEVTNTAESVV